MFETFVPTTLIRVSNFLAQIKFGGKWQFLALAAAAIPPPFFTIFSG